MLEEDILYWGRWERWVCGDVGFHAGEAWRQEQRLDFSHLQLRRLLNSRWIIPSRSPNRIASKCVCMHGMACGDRYLPSNKAAHAATPNLVERILCGEVSVEGETFIAAVASMCCGIVLAVGWLSCVIFIGCLQVWIQLGKRNVFVLIQRWVRACVRVVLCQSRQRSKINYKCRKEVSANQILMAGCEGKKENMRTSTTVFCRVGRSTQRERNKIRTKMMKMPRANGRGPSILCRWRCTTTYISIRHQQSAITYCIGTTLGDLSCSKRYQTISDEEWRVLTC